MLNNRLRNLKGVMKKTVFQQIDFTEEDKMQVKNKIRSLNYKTEDEIIISLLQLLVHEKTGYELNKLIRARGIERFENHEGGLYMILHRLEQKGYLHSNWSNLGEKYYKISDKGSKLLNMADQKKFSLGSVLKGILEG
jgi:predicted transcriptional regulator